MQTHRPASTKKNKKKTIKNRQVEMIERKTNGGIHRETDRQTDRQTDRLTD